MKLLKTDTNKDSLYLPAIKLRKKQNMVVISGKSRMPDPGQYFNNLAIDLVNYYNEFKGKLRIEFYFDYINSSSLKWIYSILQHLELLAKNSGSIEVIWKYDQDDESIELAGDVLKSHSKLPFKLIPVND